MPLTLNQIGWGAWLVRTGLTWAGSAVVAFAISDYVVKARTASMDTSLSTINTNIGSSFESINSTLSGIQSVGLDTNRKVDQMSEKLSGLTTTTALNSERIARLQADFEDVQSSSRQAASEIKSALREAPRLYGESIVNAIGQSLEADPAWKEAILKAGGENSNSPIFLRLSPSPSDVWNQD